MDYIIGIIVILVVAFILVARIHALIDKLRSQKPTPDDPPIVAAPTTPQQPKRVYERTNRDIGRDYEIAIGKFFHDKHDYKIDYYGLTNDKNDSGIDIVATKEDGALLIQCKYWMNPEGRRNNGKLLVFDQHDMREFYGDCARYINENGLNKENVLCILVMPTKKCIDLKSIVPYLSAIREHKENIDLSYEFITIDGVSVNTPKKD